MRWGEVSARGPREYLRTAFDLSLSFIGRAETAGCASGSGTGANEDDDTKRTV